MAINMYEGLPGAGKTAESVKSMVRMMSVGVGCATNIEGMDPEKAAQYVETHNFKCSSIKKWIFRLGRLLRVTKRKPETEGTPRELQGDLLVVEREDMLRDSFYPDPDRPEIPSVLGARMPYFDEGQEIFPRGKKLTPHIENYFTKHRHMVDPKTGVSVNIVLITQDADNINPFVRSLVEMTVVCEKLKKAGLTNVYVTDVYHGGYQLPKSKIRESRQFYDKSIFEIYKSYSGEKTGFEIQVDDRQNFWKQPIVWLSILFIVVVLGGGSRVLWNWTHPAALKKAQAPGPMSGAGGLSGVPRGYQQQMVQAKAAAAERGAVRLVGYYTAGNRTFIVLEDSDGRMRYQTRGGDTQIDGPRTAVRVDGTTTATFTGNLAKVESSRMFSQKPGG